MKKKRNLKFLSLLLVIALFVNNFTVPVSQAKPKVKLNKTKATIAIGNSVGLRLKNTKSKPKWSSSKKSVATVNSRGNVIAKNAGKAKITAKLGKKKYTCNVTVPKQYISATSLTLHVGENREVTIYGTSFGDGVYWKSENSNIAKVSEDGIITGLREGTTIIYGTVNNGRGKTYKCQVVVTSDVVLVPTTTQKPVVTQKPVSTLVPSTEVTITQPPADIVTAPPSDTQLVNPTIPVSGITISESNVTLNLLEIKYLSANILPLNATNKKVIWSSTNDNIVRIDNNGMVTGVSVGTAQIYVITEDGNFYASCNIVVVDNNSMVTQTTTPTMTFVPQATLIPTNTPKPTSASNDIKPTPVPTVSPTPVASTTPIVSSSPTQTNQKISNPRLDLDNHISEWDYVYFGEYQQSLYKPIAEPKEPKDEQEYVDSNGERFICRIKVTETPDVIWDEVSQKYIHITNKTIIPFYYKIEPIKWRVLNVDDDKVFLLSDQCLFCDEYNEYRYNSSWKDSRLRRKLDEFKKNIFSYEEQSAIINSPIDSDGIVAETNDDLFILSLSDIDNLEYGFGVDLGYSGKHIMTGEYRTETILSTWTDYLEFNVEELYVERHPMKTVDWWLRPNRDYNYVIPVASNYGYKISDDYHHANFVRPSMYISLSKSKVKKAGTVNSKGKYTFIK